MHRCVDISPVFASFPSAVQWTQSPYNSPIFVIVITLIAFNSVATNTYYKHDELTAACTIKCACVCASGAEGSSQYDEMGWHDGVQHTQDEHHARRQIPMMMVRQKMLPEFLASEAGAVNSLMLLNIIARYYTVVCLCAFSAYVPYQYLRSTPARIVNVATTTTSKGGIRGVGRGWLRRKFITKLALNKKQLAWDIRKCVCVAILFHLR